jgi:glycolate oxidase iron-sulfur subunit
MVNELKEIKKFQDDLEQCMKCGFCSFWCPVYQEEKMEPSVARGKNMLIRRVLSGELELTDELAKKN